MHACMHNGICMLAVSGIGFRVAFAICLFQGKYPGCGIGLYMAFGGPEMHVPHVFSSVGQTLDVSTIYVHCMIIRIVFAFAGWCNVGGKCVLGPEMLT